jgi:hypothetical protein
MGITVDQLGSMMSAQEFGQHYLLEQLEPLHQVARWRDPDVEVAAAPADAPQTVDQIMAAAKASGMVS